MENWNVIFDLDGTLIHSAPDLHAAANVALASLGRKLLDLETITSFVGNGVEKLIERCLAETGGAWDDVQSVALNTFLESYGANTTTLTRPYPGVIDCLRTLEAGGAKLGICTNKPTGAAFDICHKLGLEQYFDVITGAEAGRPKKPDARPLLDCVEALGVRADRVIYVGDSVIDYKTAKNACVNFHFFTGGYQNAPLPDIPDHQKFDRWAEHGITPARLSA